MSTPTDTTEASTESPVEEEQALLIDLTMSKGQVLITMAVAVLMWGNLLVLAGNSKQSPTPSRLCMNALAVTDFIICTNYLTALVVYMVWGSGVSPIWIMVIGIVFVWTLLFSLFLLLIIAVDR